MDDPEHNYRAYLVSTDGHIVFRVDLDETAKGDAKALVDGHIELWDGARISTPTSIVVVQLRTSICE
jgi:hypothetical protein